MPKYYTLLTRHGDNCFYPQFGDYDKKTVVSEIQEYLCDYKRDDIKIVSSQDDTLESLRKECSFIGITCGL